MERFRTALRGYDKKEVDAYLYKLTEHHESKLRELEECITHLKEENDYLYAKNGEYHRNEERVSNAILKAMQIKSDLEKEIRKKIELEEDRLRIFRTKWIAFARGLHRANADRVVEDIDGYISTFREEFVKKANRDLDLPEEEEVSRAERSYRSEMRRVEQIADESINEGKKMIAVSPEEGETAIKCRNPNARCGFTED